jgi:hypothetical protein
MRNYGKKVFDRTDKDRDLIKLMIESWVMSHQAEMAYHLTQIEEIRNNLRDKDLARSESKYGRHALEIPEDLFLKIKKIAPDFLQDKRSLTWFMREFPMFRIGYLV